MLGTMLLFRFESHDTALKKHYALLWFPLVLLDWSIVALLLALTLWYVDRNYNWRGIVICSHMGFLLLFSIWVSVRMFHTMKRKGGLGLAETEEGGRAEVA